ncbi:MAG TPA: glycosyltransferase [Tepidisphaeraceae bacterium]|nr:glycosyltransferase [Tepidisphaeraceae bacterium]
MRYLLVNHVPFFKSDKPGHVRMGDMWLEDLRAQARAIAGAGGQLIVSVPLTDVSDAAEASGSFNLVDVRPEDQGFTYRPIVRYVSMKQYLLRVRQLRAQLRDAMRDVDVVQMGYGGYPVGLGQVVFPLATKLGKKRIWIFDGGEPFVRLAQQADQMRNPAKRFIRRWMNRRFLEFCRNAIRTADLTFAHSDAPRQRFADVWNGKCYQFNRSFVTDDIILSDEDARAVEARLLDRARPLRLVAAGRQVRIKATDHVIRALAAARQRGARLELDILGDGDELPAYVALIKELDLEPHVRVRGAVPYGEQLFNAWRECDVMVVTNLVQELSRNILLAGARGLPLITYANPGSDAMLTAADAGWIVPNGNVDALAEAFVQTDANRPRLVELLHNARRLAQTTTLDETHRRRAELAAALVKR